MTKLPEYHDHDEFKTRSLKLQEIISYGIDPYPAKYTETKCVESILDTYKDQPIGSFDEALEGKTPEVVIAGRLVLFRAMGTNAFAQILEEGVTFQVMFNKAKTHVVDFDSAKTPPSQPLSPMKFIEKKLDLGDFIGVEGHLFRTQKNEITVFVKRLTLLCKSLLPLPDKHSGLADKELRYRKRWLDMISNTDVINTFKMRSNIVKAVRAYCDEHDFMEVETPVLQNIYGGAQARPFITHLHALDQQQVYLRISLEINLKKLLVGGMQRVFEIGKCFRNEGIDRNHNPEFTMIEAYAAYWDYRDMMAFTEKLFERLAKTLFNSTVVPFCDKETGKQIDIDMKAPWRRLSMIDSIKEYGGIDVMSMSDEALVAILKDTPNFDSKKLINAPRGLLIAWLFEEKVEAHLIQPVHIIDHPIETTPLCKLHRDPALRQQKIVERFESFILGQEICNAYSELNDPLLQRALLEEQERRLLEGDDEANPLDEDFVEAICQGMPPAGGLGIGIDRLVMLFCSAHSIRDVLYFPMMKPKES